MNKFLVRLVVIQFFFVQLGFSQNPTFDWVKTKVGTVSWDDCKIAIDNEKNLITTSTFNGSFGAYLDYNQTISSAGIAGTYVSKVDSLGNEIWVTYWDDVYLHPTEVKIGYDSSIYLSATWSSAVMDTFDIDPGIDSIMLTGSGNNWDGIVIKLDKNGNYLWHYRFDNVNLKMRMELGLNNEVYLASNFPDSVDCDPGSGTSYVSNGGTAPAGCFICKISESGNLLWINSFTYDLGSTAGIHALELMNNQILLGGSFKGTVDFTPFNGSDTLSSDPNGSNNFDMYLLSLDTSGNFNWVKNFTGPNGSWANKYINAVVADEFNNIIINGHTTSAVDFDPDPILSQWVNPSGSNMEFILKLDGNGNFKWVTAGAVNTSGNSQQLQTLYTDQYGNIYHCASVGSMADLDIGPGQDIYFMGLQGMCISKIDSSGNYMWGIPLVHSNSSWASNLINCVLVDEDGNVYGQGYFDEDMDFDYLGSGNIINPLNGKHFLVKYTHDICANMSTEIISSCDSFTWIDGNTYTSSTNAPIWTLTNSLGCDSNINLNLTIYYSDTLFETVEACNYYTWSENGVTYAMGGAYTELLTGINGCDSVRVLNLSLNYSDTIVDSIVECDAYTWFVNDSTYNTSDTYVVSMTGSDGCDSIRILNLTINTANTGITQLDAVTLQANEPFVSYQWLDCDQNYLPLSGANNQNFATTQNGSYAVQVTQNGCVDTSSCIVIDEVGLLENPSDAVRIYPNPSNGILYIEIPAAHDHLTIRQIDLSGRLIKSTEQAGENIHVFEMKGERGIYLIEVLTSSGEKLQLSVFKE